jgi:hypothetical protein
VTVCSQWGVWIGRRRSGTALLIGDVGEAESSSIDQFMRRSTPSVAAVDRARRLRLMRAVRAWCG